ncbi:hypothetical protein OKW21_000233 [Catalinimonas alkaloidigena]|uniref:hypothetical protein n=1 Tax=Catalinimonas alkaloidigena TaxID=1075417 RepID=UPI0024076472|nr:hypothetical protein [Catalinimonas alkaloidigena]MDF9794970.1 hypothetical protein [Catalinimonas alkaloidigena]
MKNIILTSILFTFAGCLYPDKAFSQELKKVDLAESNYKTVSIAEGQYKVSIINMVPRNNGSYRNNYAISINLKNLPVLPISIEAKSIPSMAGETAPCDELARLEIKLNTAQDPQNVEDIVKDLEKLKNNCDRDKINKLITTTVNESDFVYTVDNGQYIEVTVIDNNTTETWVWKFTTGPKGNWRTSFGVSAISDIFYPRYDYYIGTNNTQIKESANNDLLFIPSLFFTWLPSKRENKNFSFGPTGGIGSNFQEISFFLGFNLTYNQNLSFIFGIAGHQQEKLKAKFQDYMDNNSTIPSPISDSDLTTTQNVINPFFSVAFRFNRNPYSPTDDSVE